MSPSGDTVVCGLELRPREREVLVAGVPVELTSREFEILATLAEHPGWVFSADQLAEDADAEGGGAEVAGGVDRSLRDALWQLSEAVHEVEHAGAQAQRLAAADSLERARREIYAILAK